MALKLFYKKLNTLSENQLEVVTTAVLEETKHNDLKQTDKKRGKMEKRLSYIATNPTLK